MKIELPNFILETYQEGNKNHEYLIESFHEEKVKFIDSIDEHLKLERNSKEPPFGTGYIVLFKDKIVGYIYISQLRMEKVEIEYAILKSERGKKLATKLLEEVSDYLCTFENLKELYLDIDLSNSPSMHVALNSNYYPDYEEFEQKNYQGKMQFKRENPNYISKRRK